MSYKELCELHDEVAILRSTAATLGWDQEVNLQSKGFAFRAKQLSYLSSKIHEMQSSDTYRSLLESAEERGAEDGVAAANIREWRYGFDYATKIPTELVQKASETSSLAKPAWKEAREKNDFSIFAPHLEKQIEVNKQKAELWGYDDEPYSALLGMYERGADTATVNEIFGSCREELVETAKLATARAKQRATKTLEGEFPVEKQKILNREVAESIGFDFDAGRIDTTTHPFCSSVAPRDCRLTTRYSVSNFLPSLFGLMHEAGHGMYEQGLNTEEYGRPAGAAVSLGIHESQSLLWENHVGRSRGFWSKWLPRVQELFPQMLDWSVDDVLALIYAAEYSFIRVDADEATYDLHVLLRFEIERSIINGDVKVADIPAMWNEQFKNLFGIVPPDDSLGCLQDIHWSMGAIGYFATYSLGNFNASQLFAAAQRDEQVASAYQVADYAPLLSWMNKNIHSYGSQLLPQELMKQASGEGTNPRFHLEHLRKRFL